MFPVFVALALNSCIMLGSLRTSNAAVFEVSNLVTSFECETENAKRSILRSFAVALSGGLAGGFATGLLYPIDTIKTIRQSDRSLRTISSAFGVLREKGIVSIYSGMIPTALGSIPSSAIYFGSYEGAKYWLNDNFGHRSFANDGYHKYGETGSHHKQKNIRCVLSRPVIHMLAAVTGNIASSLVFVPKEAIKQKLQAINTGAITSLGTTAMPKRLDIASKVTTQAKGGVSISDVIRHIWSNSGLKGFYPSYRATLMRNIPSAVMRFTVYEELKHLGRLDANYNKVGILMVGAAASALSSACTTPLDVVKTRIATGKITHGSGVIRAVRDIFRTEGIRGLYSGVQERAVWSALFGGVGLATFESFKSFSEQFCDEIENKK